MDDKLIFVSCGQATDAEIATGQLAKTVVDEQPGFRAYFAETVHDLEGLSSNVFDALRGTAGIVAFLHSRGVVTRTDESVWGVRSSVWINQELAIAAFMQFYESRSIPVLAFAEADVKLEGAMTALIVNPKPLAMESLAAELESWLGEIAGTGHVPDADRAFAEKWSQLSPKTLNVLDCVMREGGVDVADDVVWQCLARFGMGSDDRAMGTAKAEFRRTGLVRVQSDRHGSTMSVVDAWKWHVKRSLAEWRAESGDE